MGEVVEGEEEDCGCLGFYGVDRICNYVCRKWIILCRIYYKIFNNVDCFKIFCVVIYCYIVYCCCFVLCDRN